MDALKTLKNLEASTAPSDFSVSEWKQSCYAAMNDDFNTPILIAELFNAVKYINQIKDGSNGIDFESLKTLKETMGAFIFDVLGLQETSTVESHDEKLSETIAILINMRNQARTEKNFALSDQIRDQLVEIGIHLKDGKDGTTFSLD
jgi:cysteinyl-tRNA synthetase